MNSYIAQIRIGESSPWCDCRVVESPGVALALAEGFAKQWLGAAESRFVPVSEESFAIVRAEWNRKFKRAAKPRTKSPQVEEYDEIDRAEMDREWRDNIANNHDFDPAESSPKLCGMTFEEAMQARYEREMEKGVSS